MARREAKLPQSVQLLQRRFNDAQTQFNQQFQQRMSEYTGEVGAFEKRIADYEQQAQAYLDDFDQYNKYVNSFFLKPTTNTPETFVQRGGQFYWAEDIAPGMDLRAVSNLGSLAGGDFQFVQTGARKHQYSYQEQVWVPSSRLEMRPYQAQEYQMRTTYEMVYVPPSFGSSFATGNFATGNFQSATGYYDFRPVTRNQLVTVTRYRMENIDTSSYQTRTAFANEDLPVGYLKTRTPEGEFTTMRPEQFAIRSEPAQFSVPPPEAPEGLDIADIKGQLEEEVTYLRRETGEMSAAARQARMRQRVRPLLAQTGET